MRHCHPNLSTQPLSRFASLVKLYQRGYLVLFGGFFEQAHDVKFFNDLYTYEFSTNAWVHHEFSRLAQLPLPRSAFNFALGSSDTAVLHGGFTKIKNPNPGLKQESKTFVDAWTVNLKPISEGKLPIWERMSKKGASPGGRR